MLYDVLSSIRKKESILVNAIIEEDSNNNYNFSNNFENNL